MKTKLYILIISVFYMSNTSNTRQLVFNKNPSPKRSVANFISKNALQNKSPSPVKKTKKQSKRSQRIAKSIQIYKKFAKYPHTSSPVNHSRTEDHLKLRYLNSPVELSEEGLSVKLWTTKLYYNRGSEDVVIFYEISDNSKLISNHLELKSAKTSYKIKSQKAGPHFYMAKIPSKELPNGNHSVALHINNEKSISTVFSIQEKHYVYKKIKNDIISSTGNLEFELEFDFLIPGNYVLEATLYHGARQIALAEQVVSVKNGVQTIKLSFYGKILYESQIESELSLKNLSLSFVKKSLASKNLGLLNINYKTNFYRFDQFHNRDYNDEILLKKVQIGKNI